MVTEILKAIFFGIVEGITEWLPISSTGHMILLNEFVKLQVSDEFYKLFEVVIQLGAILAVILLFFHKLNPFSPSKSAPQKRNTWRLWFKVVLAVIPSAVIGLPLDDWMDAHFYNYVVVAITLIVYGIAFLFVERENSHRRAYANSVYDIDLKTETDSILKLSSLLDDKKKIVVRISNAACVSCIQDFCAVLFQYFSGSEIIYISDYGSAKELFFMKQILGIENQVYRVEALKLPIDKEKKFYVFIIDKDLSIEKFFLPHYEQKGLMIYYLDLLKKTL